MPRLTPSFPAPAACEANSTTKKLIAKTIILLTARSNGRDTTQEQAEFQKRVGEFKRDFKLLVEWQKSALLSLSRLSVQSSLFSACPFPLCSFVQIRVQAMVRLGKISPCSTVPLSCCPRQRGVPT